MAIPSWLKGVLNRYGIPYEERRHLPALSALRLAQEEHISGHRVAKPVLVSAAGRPVTVVLPASARLDLDRVREVVGSRDVHLAAEAEIGAWFKGCPPGGVPPVRLRADHCILMDRSLAHLGKMLFAAGTLEDAIIVPFRAWYRAICPGVGRFAEINNHHDVSDSRPAVLVVEDEVDTNKLLCCLLEQKGFACRSAEEGRQALALISETPPAAILLDLMLPDISGFSVCEQLRQSGPLKRIPVIMVTALDDEVSRERGWQLGAEAYLTKPFHPDQLVTELNEVLADARA